MSGSRGALVLNPDPQWDGVRGEAFGEGLDHESGALRKWTSAPVKKTL